MSDRTLTRIAWGLLGFAAGCVVAGLAILLLTGESGANGIFPVLSDMEVKLPVRFVRVKEQRGAASVVLVR